MGRVGVGMSLEFKKVKGHDEDIQTLYELLAIREISISHKAMPSFEEHRDFVLNHPYRSWYLVRKNNTVLGSVYFHFDNSIGINMPRQSSDVILATLEKATLIHQPLPGIKSVRSGVFFVNVNPQNMALELALRRLGWSVLQVSYVCPGNFAKEAKNV